LHTQRERNYGDVSNARKSRLELLGPDTNWVTHERKRGYGEREDGNFTFGWKRSIRKRRIAQASERLDSNVKARQ